MLVGIVVLSPLPSVVPATLAAARAASGGPWLPADPLWFLNGNMFIVAGAGMTLTSLLLVMHAVLLLYAVASFFFGVLDSDLNRFYFSKKCHRKLTRSRSKNTKNIAAGVSGLLIMSIAWRLFMPALTLIRSVLL